MRTIIIVFMTILSAKGASATIADGCFAMYTRSTNEIGDSGAICLSGLYNEGVGHSVKVVTVDSEGVKHFCGHSSDITFGRGANSNLNLRLILDAPKAAIEFYGSDQEGDLKIGTTTLKYRRIELQSTERFFRQCDDP